MTAREDRSPALTRIVGSPPISATDEGLPRPGRAPLERRPTGSTASGLGPGVRRRAAQRRLGWSILIGALVAAAGVLLSRRFYYGNDDLLQFTAAREEGLSWAYLTLNVWEHFAPYNRFIHFVVLRFSDLSPSLGLALVLVNYAALLAAALWLMTELRLSTRRRVVALILIALSVPMTESAIWFDTGNHILAAIAVTLAVCAAHVRGVRTGIGHWHVLTVVLFVLGQLTQERPVFALPLLVLVDVLLLWRALPWSERLRRLWRLRGPLTALTVAAVGIAAALRAFVVVDHLRTPSWGVTGRLMLSALTNFTAPSVVNLPRREAAGLPVELIVLAALVLAGLAVAWARKGNAGPLLFTAAVFVVYYGFLKFSPLLTEHSITSNAQRLHYSVYVTVPAVIALAHLRAPELRRVRTLASRIAPSPGLRRALQVTGCLALAGYLLVTNNSYLDRHWAATTQARAYLDAVRAGAPEWSAPDLTLVPLQGPTAMATGWSWPLARHEKLLPLVDSTYAPHDPGTRFALIDDRGVTRRAVLDTVRPHVEIVGGACAPSRRSLVDNADVSFAPVRGQPLFLRLEYRANRDLDLYPSAGWRTGWTANPGITRLAGGSHTRLVPIEADRVQTLDLDVLNRDAGLCVRSATIVRPLVPVADDDTCRTVDRYGRPGIRVRCP